MILTKDQIERYSRMLALNDFTLEDQEALQRTTVTVVGAGGLGSPVLRLLTALGFGKVRIIDHDVVELSNLQRQTLYNTADIGRPKAEAAAENLSRLNPNVEFEPILASINKRDAIELLQGSDIILDGLDTISARHAVNQASVSLRRPYVYAGAIEYYGNITTFIPSRTGCLYCLLGDAKDDPERSCSTVGVTPVILTVMASIEVQEAVLLATGKEPHLAGRLMHVDMRTLSFDSFEIHRLDKCPVCSGAQQDIVEATTMNEEISVSALCTNSFNITPAKKMSLDLKSIGERLKPKHKVRVSGLFLSVELENGITVTVMKKGTAVVKGVTDPKEALRLYKSVVEI
ncbi:MAG: HesA/MoeB/ThiF family protein [Candidatus Thorarchaeota archaeon]